VAEVIELDPIEIEVFVPELYIAKIRPRDSVSITINALADRVFVGEVARIIPQADLRSRSFPVKIRLDNPQYEIKAGMLVTATIGVGEEKPSLLVPKDALVLNGPQRAVVVAAKDAKSVQTVARIVPVETGTAVGSLIQVTGALQAGDLVVIRGNERVRPGQPLRTRPATTQSPGN
jgi:RND family efflux transporter MFP subunit